VQAVSQWLRLIVSVMVTSLQFCMRWGLHCEWETTAIDFFLDYSLYLHLKNNEIKE